jgi:hypothetical protein
MGEAGVAGTGDHLADRSLSMELEPRIEKLYRWVVAVFLWCGLGGAIFVNLGFMLGIPPFGDAGPRFRSGLATGQGFLSCGLMGVAQILLSFQTYLRAKSREIENA